MIKFESYIDFWLVSCFLTSITAVPVLTVVSGSANPICSEPHPSVSQAAITFSLFPSATHSYLISVSLYIFTQYTARVHAKTFRVTFTYLTTTLQQHLVLWVGTLEMLAECLLEPSGAWSSWVCHSVHPMRAGIELSSMSICLWIFTAADTRRSDPLRILNLVYPNWDQQLLFGTKAEELTHATDVKIPTKKMSKSMQPRWQLQSTLTFKVDSRQIPQYGSWETDWPCVPLVIVTFGMAELQALQTLINVN